MISIKINHDTWNFMSKSWKGRIIWHSIMQAFTYNSFDLMLLSGSVYHLIQIPGLELSDQYSCKEQLEGFCSFPKCRLGTKSKNLKHFVILSSYSIILDQTMVKFVRGIYVHRMIQFLDKTRNHALSITQRDINTSPTH